MVMKCLVTVACFLAILCVCTASWSLDPDDPALVGLWLCDEGSGDAMIDSSGNGNDATGNFDWGEGKFGDGIAVSAGSVVVQTSDSVNSIKEALTVAGWFRVDSTSDTGIRRQNAFLLEDQSTGPSEYGPQAASVPVPMARLNSSRGNGTTSLGHTTARL